MNRLMKSKNNSGKEEGEITSVVNRRLFLRSAGLATSLGTIVIAAACNDDDPDPMIPGTGDTVDLGSGDVGVLNYAYALEQLEAAFYTQVIATPYSGMTDAEKTILTDIRDHEIIHRDFFKAALGDKAIKGLTPNFAAIDFTKRDAVLGAAKLFEDTGVAAYNGAGKLIKDDGYLVLAGKIVSVEARHAAVIRDLINPKSVDFAGDDIINGDGFDKAVAPADILAAVKGYVKDTITGANVGK
ncbi:ferritin-like domain-containing protein [Dyadobacter chenwenxiniae]|uniref:Ferritin-like domain-containing protein n=1 Tax=Dyadobacter chenwenxiniae TaxID=2906456 RepID=A0A9X1TGR2_9BACT|nr:ferritin-like domain-containing protein [Dyadobacter chenwenxiniae]MCF0063879.1 ferritin-like domain-containing protein [Dyadobacter chenwenxiniae]UON82611.1 ferritin-like domain-containing protein [Dyadobacter chenwenxiniae]